MAHGESSKTGRPWPWAQFAIALGLLPVGALSWVVGMNAVFDPHPDPIGAACLYASPFLALTGALWLLVLLVRRFF